MHDHGLSVAEREELKRLLASEGIAWQQQGIPLRAARDTAPLSNAQERLWVVHQLDPESSRYHLFAGVRLEGRLCVPALARAFARIVDRHEILRTSFVAADWRPTQMIARHCRVALPFIDLTAVAPTHRDAQLHRVAQPIIRQPFDLALAPLLRPVLVRLGSEDHAFMVVVHHLVSDGWSVGLFVKELATIYDAERRGRDASLPPLPIQYGDYAAWQREQLGEGGVQAQFEYWKRTLHGLRDACELPTDFLRREAPVAPAATELRRLGAELAAHVKALADRARVTPFIVVLTAVSVLLHRYTGAVDVAVGSAVAGRTRRELEPLLGLFVNTLVLRTDLSGDPSVATALARVREVALEAYANQDVPFDALVDELGAARDAGRTPLYQLAFVWQTFGRDAPALPGLSVTKLALAADAAPFDLQLSVWESGEGLAAEMLYRPDLFARATISRMLRHLELLLAAFVRGDGQRISELPMFTADERAVAGWGAGARAAVDLPAHLMFASQVTRTPDAVAVVSGAAHVTYRALNRRINRLAHCLADAGVGPEAKVAVCLERSDDLLVAVLGTLKAGGAYVPVDPAHPVERALEIVARSRPRAILTSARWRDRFAGGECVTLCLDADRPRVDAYPDTEPPAVAVMSSAAYVMFTSGSTGVPKGVVVTHEGLANYLQWSRQAYDAGRIGSAVHSSIGFDLTVTSLYLPLLAGGRVWMIDERDGVDTAEQLRSLLAHADLVKLTPAHLQLVVPAAPELLPPAATTVVIGGEALFYHQVAEWRASAPRARLINEYGPTETVVGCCVHEVAPADPDEGRVPIGRPIANSTMRVLDRRMRPVPLGAVGELYIGGRGVARGYLGEPGLTAERFVPDPDAAEPGARLYRTGDRVRWHATGELEYLDRIDNQVKIRGYRIELGEIEAALAVQPGVAAAAATVRRAAGGEPHLIAYVVAGTGAAVDGTALRSALRRRLPDYMVPSSVGVVDSLPLTTNGKVDRRALAKIAPATAPEDADGEPQGPIERLLADVWAQVLQLASVGRHDNFFELGGDSILSMQIVARARARHVHFTSADLFRHQTIAGLAAATAWAAPAEAPQGVITGEVPLTPIQHWLFDRALAAPDHFNQAVVLELQEPLDPRVLDRAIGQVLHHHDALRSRFVREGSTWRQWQLEREDQRVFSHIDLSALSTAQQRHAWVRIVHRLQTTLDLARGPLVHAAYVSRGPARRALLFIAVHHLVIDGVSWRIVLEDLRHAYDSLSRREPLRLPRKTTSFQRWAEVLRSFASDAALAAERDYWAGLDRRGSRPLPRDGAGTNSVASQDAVGVELTPQDTAALLRDIPRVFRARIGEVLLAALGEALVEWSGGDRVAIDVEVHGREPIAGDVDLSRTVGWLTSIYPVVMQRSASAAPDARFRAAKEQLRHIRLGGLGYGILRYLAREPRMLARERQGPRSDVVFNYLGQFDQALGGLRFVPSSEPAGPVEDPRNVRPYALEITAWIAEGCFRATCHYSRELHAADSIRRVMDRFREVLESAVRAAGSDAFPAAAAEFPLARLSRQDLDAVLDAVRAN